MASCELFLRFPALAESLPYEPLADLPTPIELVDNLKEVPCALCVKRDDLTGTPYGGNKVRKLEFVLGQALAEERKRVITVGGAGSNHALCTAVYAKELGMDATLLLFPQPNARSVRENLLMDLLVGADVHPCERYEDLHNEITRLTATYAAQDGVEPMFIPGGGSSPVGTVGYVNAGLELAAQIDAGDAPAPAGLYAALGTMGTVAGLMIGLRVAGLDTRVVGVRVVPTTVGSERRLLALLEETVALLCEHDPSFPQLSFGDSDVDVVHDFYGEEYGRHTAEALHAMDVMGDAAGVHLDGTYTGKAAAAMLAAVQTSGTSETVLFWDTKNSRPVPQEALSLDYHRLPVSLQRYFEEPTQEELAGSV